MKLFSLNKNNGAILMVDKRQKYRTQEQKDALYYFSDRNYPIGPNKGCLPEEDYGCGAALKGCITAPYHGCRDGAKGCIARVEKFFSWLKDAIEKGCKGCGKFLIRLLLLPVALFVLFVKKNGQLLYSLFEWPWRLWFQNPFKGCLPRFKYITDEEYDKIVANLVQSADPGRKGLMKLGIDESQVKEIAPITFENYVYKPVADRVGELKDYFFKVGEDGKFRSSVYQVTTLFFSSAQIFVYQLNLNTQWNIIEEKTFEYHYKDITSFRSYTRTQDEVEGKRMKGNKGCKPSFSFSSKLKKDYVVENSFKIIVPGDELVCTLKNYSDAKEEGSIQAMKAMLREKKF